MTNLSLFKMLSSIVTKHQPTSNPTIFSYSNSETQKETCKSLVVTIFQIIDDDLFIMYSTNRLQVAFNYVITAKLT